MGLTARQRRVFDTEPSIQKAHKKAVAMHEQNVRGQKVKKKIKKTWVSKLKRSVKELIGGRKTYMPKSKKYETTRTKATKRGLKAAGLTSAEIKKLGGK